MKKIFFVAAAALFLGNVAEAQKAKVSDAKKFYNLYEAGMASEIDKAKPLIDEAILDPKTGVDPQTYILAAQIYAALGQAQKVDNGFEMAKKYILEAKSLDDKGDAKGKGIGKYAKKLQEAYEDLAKAAEKLAYAANEQKNYKVSQAAFLDQIWFNSKKTNYTEQADTVILFNVGLLSYFAEDWKMGGDYFAKAAGYNYGGDKAYLYGYQCYANAKDSLSAEKLIKVGVEKFPESKDVINQFINFSIAAGKDREALEFMDKMIERDSKNPQYYFARGLFYSNSDASKAIPDFQKALEVDPNYFAAAYSIGLTYFTIGEDLNKEANSTRNFKEADALAEKAKGFWKQSIEPFEKALDMTSDKTMKLNIMEFLKAAYYKTGNYEKNKAISDKIREMQQ